MDKDSTTPTAGSGRRDSGGGAGAVAARADVAAGRGVRRRSGWSPPALKLRSVSEHSHTLVLTGELTHSSANALELEIERLCAEGVTSITLDLRKLEQIDATGVAVIAFRCRLCERQGYGFTLIPGSPFVQRSFERAGVLDALPFCEEDPQEHRLPA